MKKIFLFIFSLSLILTGSAFSEENKSLPLPVDKELRSRLGKNELIINETQEGPETGLKITRFFYEILGSKLPSFIPGKTTTIFGPKGPSFSRDKRDPASDYFTPGLAVWSTQPEKLIWHLNNREGEGYHSISWVDLNQDGRKDLFLFSGEEEDFNTYIFLNRIRAKSYFADHFIEVYKNHDHYSALCDPDKDGHPEILTTGYPGGPHQEAPQSCRITPELEEQALKEYSKLMGAFDAFNFHYGMPTSYSLFNLFLFDPIKILKIQGSKVVDITEKWPEHLQWRLKFLDEVKKRSDASCAQTLKPKIIYLKQRVKKY